MFSVDAYVLTFGIYALQIILLPSQLFSFLTRRIDKTRSRFLSLSASFIAFNSFWIASESLGNYSFELKSLLPFVGILLSVQVYRYLTIELDIIPKRLSWIHLMVALISVELLRQIVFPIISTLNRDYFTFFFFLIYELTALTFITISILAVLKKKISHKPLFIAGMITLCIGLVIPIFLFYVENEFLKNPFINVCFFAIGFAYAKFYFPQIRLEEKNRRLFISPKYFESTMSEKKLDVPDLFSDCDLTTREYEILLDLLNGLSYQNIADKDFRSVATVRRQAATIFSKIGDVKDLKEFRAKFS